MRLTDSEREPCFDKQTQRYAAQTDNTQRYKTQSYKNQTHQGLPQATLLHQAPSPLVEYTGANPAQLQRFAYTRHYQSQVH
ncbi:hypothetical protein [Shewanella sp. SR44-3]|uniref:hypothetical protein n=1 Tax=Shewanella sp. SR44-3 TaxID=2760936 RepID=UPI0015FABBA1|nr:hypothetical protein [Shewanella sp. SR44-3]MBB1270104.1 hypothetical protein [Shewanella sp. SR44-3]